jgi:hypothetical protein
VGGVVLRLLACCDSGFESRQRHGCLFLVSVVLCQLKVYSTGRSLVQSTPSECSMSECDRVTSEMRPKPTGAVQGEEEEKKKNKNKEYKVMQS